MPEPVPEVEEPEVPDDWSLELNKQRMQAEEAVQRDTHSPRTRGRIRSARRTGRLGGYAYSQSSSPPRGRLSYAYEGSPATSEGVIDLVEGVGDSAMVAVVLSNAAGSPRAQLCRVAELRRDGAAQRGGPEVQRT